MSGIEPSRGDSLMLLGVIGHVIAGFTTLALVVANMIGHSPSFFAPVALYTVSVIIFAYGAIHDL